MSKLRIHAFSISLDGYGAGPDQSLDNPLGRGGEALHEWFLPTRTFQRMSGKEQGTTGIDEDFAARGFDNIGAWILGRNMFGPVRGPWPDQSWRAGGAKTRPITAPSSSSQTMRVRRCKWRAARSSTSSLTASRPRSPARGRRRTVVTSASVAAAPLSGNI